MEASLFETTEIILGNLVILLFFVIFTLLLTKQIQGLSLLIVYNFFLIASIWVYAPVKIWPQKC